MSETGDGGPAFPLGNLDAGQYGLAGMSLRDYFAAKALAGCYHEALSSIEVAARAYDIADAMLRVRDRSQPPVLRMSPEQHKDQRQ